MNTRELMILCIIGQAAIFVGYGLNFFFFLGKYFFNIILPLNLTTFLWKCVCGVCKESSLFLILVEKS